MRALLSCLDNAAVGESHEVLNPGKSFCTLPHASMHRVCDITQARILINITFYH